MEVEDVFIENKTLKRLKDRQTDGHWIYFVGYGQYIINYLWCFNLKEKLRT